MQEGLNLVKLSKNNWENRKLRLKFLVENYQSLGLANYPWGLSRSTSEDRVKRYNKLIVIFRKLQREGLLALSTNFADVNFNNLIIDARKLYYESRKNEMDNSRCSSS